MLSPVVTSQLRLSLFAHKIVGYNCITTNAKYPNCPPIKYLYQKEWLFFSPFPSPCQCDWNQSLCKEFRVSRTTTITTFIRHLNEQKVDSSQYSFAIDSNLFMIFHKLSGRGCVSGEKRIQSQTQGWNTDQGFINKITKPTDRKTLGENWATKTKHTRKPKIWNGEHKDSNPNPHKTTGINSGGN